MVFPVVIYGCESWTLKKAECQKIDAFELWCWRRLLRVPWTVRRSNQSILKEISPGCSLEGLLLKLKLQYLATSSKELTHWKRPWCWEGLGAGVERDNRGWDGWMASPTQWTWVWVNSWSCWWTGRPGVLRFMELQRVRHDWVTELNWTKDTFTGENQISYRWEFYENLRLPGSHPDLSRRNGSEISKWRKTIHKKLRTASKCLVSECSYYHECNSSCCK